MTLELLQLEHFLNALSQAKYQKGVVAVTSMKTLCLALNQMGTKNSPLANRSIEPGEANLKGRTMSALQSSAQLGVEAQTPHSLAHKLSPSSDLPPLDIIKASKVIYITKSLRLLLQPMFIITTMIVMSH